MTKTKILNLDTAPADALERIVWLDGVMEQVRSELDDAYADAYFHARVTARFEDALRLGKASKKRALAWTRRVNERTGRSIRWGDALDPTSTSYRG
jgi:hypothetical protein